MIVLLFEATQGTGQITRDTRFLGNNQRLRHVSPQLHEQHVAGELRQFNEIISWQLFNEPLQLEAQESRRDSGCWQIAFGRDRVDAGFG